MPAVGAPRAQPETESPAALPSEYGECPEQAGAARHNGWRPPLPLPDLSLSALMFFSTVHKTTLRKSETLARKNTRRAYARPVLYSVRGRVGAGPTT